MLHSRNIMQALTWVVEIATQNKLRPGVHVLWVLDNCLCNLYILCSIADCYITWPWMLGYSNMADKDRNLESDQHKQILHGTHNQAYLAVF